MIINPTFATKYEEAVSNLVILPAREGEDVLDNAVEMVLGDMHFYVGETGFYNGNVIAYRAVTQEMLDEWGIDKCKLFEDAGKSSMEKYPPKFGDMDSFGVIGGDTPLYVLTNENTYKGASVLLYPDMPETIAAFYNMGFYVIPSSKHECLIVYSDKDDNVEEQIKQIIKDVNDSGIVEDEDIFGYLPVYYDYNEKAFK